MCTQEVDIARVATEADKELLELQEKWMAHLNQTDLSDPQNYFRIGLLKLAFSYARLVALSFGFQHVFSKKYDVENPFLIRVRPFLSLHRSKLSVEFKVPCCCLRCC